MTLRAYGWAGVSTPDQARSEKESLPAQRREIELAVQRMPDVHLVEILEVPGFSRDYIDFHECKLDMLKDKIDAFVRLEQLWQRREIDLFICRDADRFGRTLPILTYIGAQLIYTAGARIFLTAKNIYIDKNNYNTLAALFGLMAADEIERLRARHAMGMAGRFRRGLSGNRPPYSHRLVGEKGNQRLVLDESKARFWADLRDLLMAGFSYTDIAAEMAKRGHRRRDGTKYTDSFYWRVLHNPYTFGHVAFHWRQNYGAWAYDPNAPLPPRAEVLRDKIEPVWKGAEMEDVVAALRYRAEVSTGRGKRDTPKRFTGLLICATCGNTLVYCTNNLGRAYYRCITHHKSAARTRDCTERRFIREDRAQSQINDFLILAAQRAGSLFADPESAQALDRLASLNAEIEVVQNTIRMLIRKQAEKPDIADLYDEDIARFQQALADKRAEVARLSGLTETPAIAAQRECALDDAKRPGFWNMSDGFVNQTLHRFAGGHRFIVKAGEIVDFRRVR